MVVITGITGLAVAVYALADVDEQKEALGYHALYQVLLAGVCGAFLTGDLFNLYVWFEVMLISSFGLLILGGRKEQLDGGIKYVTLNLVSTILFLSGIGLLYGMTGTLNMADLHTAVQDGRQPRPFDRDRGHVHDRLRGEGRRLPVVLLAARLLSHACLFGLGDLCGASDQGGGLFADPHVHADLHDGCGLYPYHPAVGRGLHHGHGRSGCGCDERFPPYPVIPHRQSDRLHDPWPRAVHAIGACGRGVLPRAPHHREGEPVPCGGRGATDRGVDGPRRDRRALQDRAASGGPVPDPRLLACRVPTAQRVLGEIRSRESRTRRGGLRDRRCGFGRWSAHDLLHDENLGQRVLETAPGRHRAQAHLACAQGPRSAFAADRGTGRANMHHRPVSRAIRGLRGAFGRTAS
jgi:hypothetical protein